MIAKSSSAKFALACVLGLLLAVIGLPAGNHSTVETASALGFQSRNCSAWDAGDGYIHGFSAAVSGNDYGWTEIIDPCGFGVSVALKYQSYQGGPLYWTSRSLGQYFVVRSTINIVVNGEHCRSGLFCFVS